MAEMPPSSANEKESHITLKHALSLLKSLFDNRYCEFTDPGRCNCLTHALLNCIQCVGIIEYILSFFIFQQIKVTGT